MLSCRPVRCRLLNCAPGALFHRRDPDHVSGDDTLVGTGDSITLDGYKANKRSAADFSFGASAPLTAFAAMSGDMQGHHADVWML